ncbi:Dolichyl-phosphate-mannose-protein mannosyltransferase [Posidoniimonas corsicana]|uniref:Dolichyl-phosphate-mannose-protein mannosyltransferase n=1 Tax=Posidoniimonas corsicana TaxID=1938618 RepID=A0A5C5VGS4_9BACT|nr:glycosyltransferase family 39 protein [Posidoniimonas corsicana]TWT37157.1 Dolichyl-phosphate-mannose-protein mannosyltransferase [Posidoniimonas corsicana]
MSSLLTSFQRLGQLVDQPRVAGRVVVGLLAVHTSLLMYSAYVHSPTLNEPGHLVAGLSHWKFGRFELYRVNPPLVRMAAALPVMAVGYESDWSGFYEGPGARPVFDMGKDFVAANGTRTFFLTMIARWACIPFSWLGAVVCYLWGRDLYGRTAGLIACLIWCFEPNILAHASLITADAHATALGLAACYTFWRWLKTPTWAQAALTGVVLGLAELAKTTLILFYPLWPMLWLAYRWQDRATMTPHTWGREAGMLVLRMAIGLYVVNLGYGFDESFMRLKEFHFVSKLFTGEAPPDSETREPKHEFTNRFASTWLADLPVPFPKNYLLGIDTQQKDFESYGRPSYLRGEWRDRGWWHYYLYAGLIKVPLGLLTLGGACILLSLWGVHPAPARDSLLLLTPAIVVLCVVSSKTGFSEHFRYVLPAFPYAFIWISGVITAYGSRIFERKLDKSNQAARIEGNAVSRADTCVGSVVSTGLLVWLSSSSLWIYPHSLSYFNESIGGPLNGAEHLLGSSVDWGQDLRYVYWDACSIDASSRLSVGRLGSLRTPGLFRCPCHQTPAPLEAQAGQYCSVYYIHGGGWDPWCSSNASQLRELLEQQESALNRKRVSYTVVYPLLQSNSK